MFKNAIDAMPEGGCLILKAFLCGGKTVKLEISDTGPGIPEGARIFDSFVTTKPGGLGLGLPIVREIIAAHNGTVHYASQPGQGTTFTIALPPPQDSVITEADSYHSNNYASSQSQE
jgi:two-component system, NtrC family, sensor histidine kinase HydH